MFKGIKISILFLVVCIRVSIANTTHNGTAFPDSSYNSFTWQSFQTSSFANQKIDLFTPDLDLLNAAIFYAINEQRELKKLKPLKFSAVLRDAAVFHTDKMIELKFFNDKNKKDTLNYTPTKRVVRFGGNFKLIGENIGKNTLMDFDEKKKYLVFKQEPDYKYFFNNGKDEIQPTTYILFAKKIVEAWMKNKQQKINLIYTPYEYMGCGVNLSTKPYKERKLPSAVVTGVFGGYVFE